MSQEVNIAIVALIVSLVALFIALVQLLQQVFGTAEGYRRCQDSVIGPWAKRTRLNRRWKEFRLETMYTTPGITFVDASDDKSPEPIAPRGLLDKLKSRFRSRLEDNEKGRGLSNQPDEGPNDDDTGLINQLWSAFKHRRGHIDTGTSLLRDSNMIMKPENITPDMVTWITLLHQAQKQENKALKNYPDTRTNQNASPNSARVTIIHLEAKVRSWDLNPPEVVKPLASIPLGSLIVLAHRLGMRWWDLRVTEGLMRAEGRGHSLVSPLVRGVGPVFQYSFHTMALPSASARRDAAIHWIHGRESLIPHKYVDMMACGIVPYCQELGLREVHVTGMNSQETRGLMLSAMLDLGVMEQEAEKMTEPGEMTKLCDDPLNTGTSWAFGDWVSVVVDFLPRTGSPISQIIGPYYTKKLNSTFLFLRCRRPYLNRLRQYSQISGKHPKVKEILEKVELLAKDFNDDFTYDSKSLVNLPDDAPEAEVEKKQALIKCLREIHAMTSKHFRDSSAKVDIKGLIAAHVAMTNGCYEKARAIDNRQDPSVQSVRGSVRAETVHMLVDRLDEIVARTNRDGQELTPEIRALIECSWWMLVLRGISWNMSVRMIVSNYFVPSHLYDSQTHVYIT